MTVSNEDLDMAGMVDRSRKDAVISKVKRQAEAEGLTLIFVGSKLYGITTAYCTLITEGTGMDDAYAKALQIPLGWLKRSGFSPLSTIENEKWSIPADTVIPEGLKLPPGTWTGARCVLSEGVVAGDRLRLGKNSVVHEGCIIGDDWLIGKDSLVMPCVCLGKRGQVAYNATFDVETGFASDFEVTGVDGEKHTVDGDKPWKVGMFTWDGSECYICLTELPYSRPRGVLKKRVQELMLSQPLIDKAE